MFVLVRRGYYWLGPVLRGYAISPRAAWTVADRATAEQWARLLDAVVHETGDHV